MKSFLHYLVIIILFTITNNSFSQNFWQTINGPQGGNYRRIKSNPINNNTYLLTYWNTNHGNGVGGNIFNSTNNGGSWNEIDNGLFAQGIWDIAYSTNSNDLIIATSPASATGASLIYHSPDNGQSWIQKSTSTFSGTNTLAGISFNATNDTIFAGKKGAGVVFTTSAASDYGNNWPSMSTGITNLQTSDLEYGYQGKLYISTDSFSVSNGAKVFRKSGTSWINFSAGLTNTKINDLYYDAATSTMYLGTANIAFGTGKVYKSVNGGVWTLISGYTGAQIQSIIVSNDGDLLVNSLNQGIYRYSGGVWTLANTNLNSLKISSMGKDVAGNILVTTRAGIWKFNDTTNDWSYFTNGIYNSQPRSLSFAQNGNIVVGTDNGMYYSADGGNSWNHAGLTDNSMMSTILYEPDGRMFAGNTDNANIASHIYISPDNGVSWTQNDVGFASTRSADIAYTSTGEIFVGTGWANPINVSTDGINWTPKDWSTTGFGSSTLALAIAIDSLDIIYTGHENDGMWRSIDNGASFQYIGLNYNPSNVSDIKISPNQTIFVSQTPFAGNPNGMGNGFLFKSTDGGTSWSNTLLTTHGQPNCVFIASDDSIYVGSTQGVWLSTDTGSTWSLLNTGLNTGNVAIHTLELGPDGYLYAGTGGAGVYRSVNKIKNTGTTLNISNSSANKTDIIFYPNPASETVHLNGTVTEIKIFNTQGELVLIEKNTNQFSCRDLNDGIYFIHTGTKVQKLIVKH